MHIYLALLRGINVGRDTAVPMARLRELFADLGCLDVRTYIQSGNVVFSHSGQWRDLHDRIESAIEKRFGLKVPVMMRDQAALDAIVAANPFRDRDLDPAKVGVAFCAHAVDDDADLRPSATMEEIIVAGSELYIYYPNGMGRTALTPSFFRQRLPDNPMTVRNWRTVARLHAMMHA